MNGNKRLSGLVYVFGSGDCGQLGLGEDVLSRKKPTLLPFFHDKRIVEVSAGGLHNLALSEEGCVYSWGCNDEKALGHDLPEWSVGPVQGLAHERIIHIAAGDSISAALTVDGKVYAWGTFRDSKGILGYNERMAFQERPMLVQELSQLRVKSLSAGANHLVAISEDGKIFSWGCGEQGQLGRRVLERHKLKGLKPHNITPNRRRSAHNHFTHITCGSYHTLALNESGSISSWGLNNYGQLGQDDTNERMLPEVIPDSFFQSQKIKEMAAGEHHSIALTHSGTIFAWGRGDSGQLATLNVERSLHPLPVTSFPPMMNSKKIHPIAASSSSSSPRFPSSHSPIIVSLASGSNHCLALDENNQVYSWGYGGMLQLGNGQEEDVFQPYRIEFPHGKVLQLQAGGQHSMLLCQPL